MGGQPYSYVVPYEADTEKALQELRAREFKAGRYNPVTPFPSFPVDVAAPSPGAGHATYEEALEASDADGTRSIIDLMFVSPTPWDGQPTFCTVYPVAEPELVAWFGTKEPDLDTVLASDFWEDLQRGSGVCIVLYEAGRPKQLFFAGYSFD